VSSRQERSCADFLTQVAIADIAGAGEFLPNQLEPSFDYSSYIEKSGVMELVDNAIFKTEAFIAATVPQEYRNPVREVTVKTQGYEYIFRVPINNIKRFKRKSLVNPNNSLRVVITPDIVEVEEKLDGKKTHLWNCDAALWLVIGAINEYARSSRDIRSIPPSL